MLALTAANLKMLARNRQATFWAIIFPLLLVVAFGLFDINSVGRGSLAVVDLSGGPRSQLLREKLAEIENFESKRDPDNESAGRRQVADKDLDYLIVIPQSFDGQELGGPDSQAGSPPPGAVRLVYDTRGGERNQLVDGLVRSLVAETQRDGLSGTSPQLVITEVIEAPEADYFDEVLMGLIALGIMTNSIISIAVRVSTYRNQAILKRLLVTPLPIWKYFAGEIAAHLVLVVVQVAILLAVGIFAFGADVQGNLVWIFLISLLGAVVFLNIGFILSAWARSPAAASGMGNAVALPMMFFAGAFFSTATLPWVLPHAAQVLPLTPMLEALREVAIDSASLWDTWRHLGALAIWAGVTAVAAVRVFRFT